MKEIRLDYIEKKEQRITYFFSCSDELSVYFSGEKYVIDYPDRIEDVPNGILVLPFVSTVIALCWLTDSRLVLPFLDKNFFEAIPEIKKAYEEMYPQLAFGGKIIVEQIEDNIIQRGGKVALFFSGGVDATTTLFRHIDENPSLLTIWGADVAYNNETGWNIVKKGIEESAKQYNLDVNYIHSSFRQFDKEATLDRDFSRVLKDDWWHAVKHGIAIICHAAPYVWIHSIDKLYIASSYSPEDGKVTCASYPTIDNCIKFCGCNVYHDAFEWNRQRKIQSIIEYKKNNPTQTINLRVCWESSEGRNCCKCEKCYRTIAGLLVEGANPSAYGFDFGMSKKEFDDMYSFIALKYDRSLLLWKCIGRRLNDNWKNLRHIKNRNMFKWIKDFNFEKPNNNRCRKMYVLKEVYKHRLKKIFPFFYRLYLKKKYGK